MIQTIAKVGTASPKFTKTTGAGLRELEELANSSTSFYLDLSRSAEPKWLTISTAPGGGLGCEVV